MAREFDNKYVAIISVDSLTKAGFTHKEYGMWEKEEQDCGICDSLVDKPFFLEKISNNDTFDYFIPQYNVFAKKHWFETVHIIVDTDRLV